MDLRLGDAHLLPARSAAVAPRYVCLIVLQSAVSRQPCSFTTTSATYQRCMHGRAAERPLSSPLWPHVLPG